MKISQLFGVLLLAWTFVIVGCKEATPGAKKDSTASKADTDEREPGRKGRVKADMKTDAEPEKKADTEPEKKVDTEPAKKSDGKEDENATPNLVKLDPAKRKLAEAQKLCPISDDPLGTASMGVPIELTIEGQTVFICCKGCEKSAMKDPAKTLAKVKELVAKNAPAAK